MVRVLNGELYAQRFRRLIYLLLFAECFMEISQLLEQAQVCVEVVLNCVCSAD